MISVVIPTLNAERTLQRALAPLVPAAVEGLVREVVVADGGSTDRTLELAEDAGANIVRTERGRGVQLAAGCAAAKSDWLLILHADTELADGWQDAAAQHLRYPDKAGWFRFALDDGGFRARLWERGVALRCGLLSLPYGDQGLLISRGLYEEVGGFRPLPLMEDVDLVRRLGARRLRRLDATAVTSAERYRRDGYLGRSLGNAILLARYLAGADPERLARAYA